MLLSAWARLAIALPPCYVASGELSTVSMIEAVPFAGIVLKVQARTFRFFYVMRALLALRLLALWPNFTVRFSKAFSELVSLMGVLAVSLYMFALVGMHLFGHVNLPATTPSYQTFDTFWHSLLSCFQLFTAANWGSLAAVYMAAFDSRITWWFFAGFHLWIQYSVANLIAATVYDNFATALPLEQNQVFGGLHTVTDVADGADLDLDPQGFSSTSIDAPLAPAPGGFVGNVISLFKACWAPWSNDSDASRFDAANGMSQENEENLPAAIYQHPLTGSSQDWGTSSLRRQPLSVVPSDLEDARSSADCDLDQDTERPHDTHPLSRASYDKADANSTFSDRTHRSSVSTVAPEAALFNRLHARGNSDESIVAVSPSASTRGADTLSELSQQRFSTLPTIASPRSRRMNVQSPVAPADGVTEDSTQSIGSDLLIPVQAADTARLPRGRMPSVVLAAGRSARMSVLSPSDRTDSHKHFARLALRNPVMKIPGADLSTFDHAHIDTDGPVDASSASSTVSSRTG